MPPDTSRPIWSFFGVLCLVAFSLNWLWEMVQMPAFTETAGKSWQESTLTCTVASLGDVVIMFAVYGTGALAAGHIRWGMSGRWNVYGTAAILGGVSGVAFEWFSLSTNRWSYNDRMPIVPILGVGLWPMLQLLILVPMSFWIAILIRRR